MKNNTYILEVKDWRITPVFFIFRERWHKVGTIGTFSYGFGVYAMGQYKYSRRCLLGFMCPDIGCGSLWEWGVNDGRAPRAESTIKIIKKGVEISI